jgi:leader peptidase (prepilin peptidase)/N-methyltransferase
VALIPFVVFVALGASVGSFLALVVDRVSRGQSIVAPPSHCGTCKRRLRLVDNVPIVSWVLLRGRCRSCKAFIPLHVLLFEIAGAVLGAVAAFRSF